MKNECSVSLQRVLNALQCAQVIAYPTEAVFGLGCDPDSEEAVERLLSLKQRSWEKGLILVAANYQQLLPYIDDEVLLPAQRSAMFSRWPGPVTWVIPAKPQTPAWLTGQFRTLAVRVTDHPLVQQLCLRYGKPLVSTSANLTGQEPCRTVEAVEKQFGEHFPILKGEVGGRHNPSEIRDVLTGALYRHG